MNDTNGSVGIVLGNYTQVYFKSRIGIKPSYTNRDLSVPYKYIYVTLCCVVALVSIFGNVVVSWTIIRYRKLHRPTNLLLLNLITTDLLTGLVMIPFYIERFLHQGMQSSQPTLCLFKKYLFIVSSSGSLISLAIVCFDRMLFICYPFFHQRRMKKRVAIAIIICTWIWIIGYNSFVFYQHEDWDRILRSCVIGLPRLTYYVVIIPNFYMPGVVILFVYGRIFLIAHKENKKIHKHRVPCNTASASSTPELSCSRDDSSIPENGYRDNNVVNKPRLSMSKSLPAELNCACAISLGNSKLTNTSIGTIPPLISPDLKRARSITTVTSTSDSPLMKIRSKSSIFLQNALEGSKTRLNKISTSISRDTRALKTVAIMIGLFLICWGPTAIFFIIENDTSSQYGSVERQKLSFYLAEIFMLITFVNSAINPYLYAWRNKQLREATAKTLRNILHVEIKRTNSQLFRA